MSVRATSAMPVALRSFVPAKITSSMREPRSVLADCSPNTQEIASEIFDLPHPLGPMIAATPSPWNFSSVRSQNDLNPRICSLFSLSNVDSFEPVASRSVGASLFAPSWLKKQGIELVYRKGSPPGLDAIRLRHTHPRLDRAGTNLSYCTDEFQAASSNITLYIVGG